MDGDKSTKWTPLVLASMHGHETVVQLLLAHGADVNAQNLQGFTALYCATRYRFAKLRELLLQHGADDTIASSDGTTPAQLAGDSDYTPGSPPAAEPAHAQSPAPGTRVL